AGGKDGAELVANLSSFYDYICQRLMYANLRNDPALLDEADRLLDTISSAWREIDPQKPAAMPEAANGPTTRRFSAGA
ncbi:MAG: flagellar export chaperone FliS, partial [Polaromonas sp.]